MERDPTTDPNLTPQARELATIAYRYHPRWHPAQQELDDFMEGVPFTPETLAREDLTAEKLTNNRAWHGLLAEVKEAFPDYWVADGRAPGVNIPSYQLVVAYLHPPASTSGRYLVFRLSFLAPVYDFYESDQDPVTRQFTRWRQPTPESSGIAVKVAEIMARHFEHTWLDPEIGAIVLPGLGVEGISPGKATIEDAIFEDGLRW